MKGLVYTESTAGHYGVFLMQVCHEKSSEMRLQNTPTSSTIVGQIKFLLLVLTAASQLLSFQSGHLAFGQEIPLLFAVAAGGADFGMQGSLILESLWLLVPWSLCRLVQGCSCLTDFSRGRQHQKTSAVLAIFCVVWARLVRIALCGTYYRSTKF